MSSPTKAIVLLVVSLLLMQVNLGLAAGNNGSISIEIVQVSTPPPKSGALSNSITGLTALWLIPIGFGPAGVQPFNLLIDTGKSDLLVADASCRSFWCQNVVPTAAKYISGNSPNTFFNTRQSVSLSYFDGKRVTGITSQDEFTIAPDIVGRQDFIRVTSATGFTNADAYDGILGLAPGRNTRNRISVIEKLFEGNSIASKIFSIRTAAGVTSLNIGNLPAPVAPQTLLTYVNVATSGVWNFRAQLELELVGPVTTVITRNAVFRIETILPNIGVPASGLNALVRLFRATLNRRTGLYEFNCALNAATTFLVFTISNQRYLIPSANFLTNNAGVCSLNLFVTSGDWILGQQFLTIVDTVYDASRTPNRIGFFN